MSQTPNERSCARSNVTGQCIYI